VPDQLKAIAFDVDVASAACLRAALPGWQTATVYGATVASLPCDWDPGAADLLVVGAREDVAETWGLCRFLTQSTSAEREPRQVAAETSGLPRNRLYVARRTKVPLLVLLRPGKGFLVEAGFEAGAHSCLIPPINRPPVYEVFRVTYPSIRCSTSVCGRLRSGPEMRGARYPACWCRPPSGTGKMITPLKGWPARLPAPRRATSLAGTPSTSTGPGPKTGGAMAAARDRRDDPYGAREADRQEVAEQAGAGGLSAVRPGRGRRATCFARPGPYDEGSSGVGMGQKPAPASAGVFVGRLDEGQPGRAGGPVDE
jgi:hypothetical protein